jgi:hypothetical protein
VTANLYYLLGFREYAYRKEAVKALNLQAGDTVVKRQRCWAPKLRNVAKIPQEEIHR